MKETRRLLSHSTTRDNYLDSTGRWFFELLGWRCKKSTSSEHRYVEKNTYLVSDGRDGFRLEDRYKSSRSGYDLCHTLERETSDPRYDKYCELEKRVPFSMWDDDYIIFRSKLEHIFTDNKFPKKYDEYKHKYIRYYIYSVLLLAVFGLFMWVMSGPQEYELSCYLFLGALLVGVVVCIIRGIVGQIQSYNKGRIEEEYRDYLEKWFEEKPYPVICKVIKEALKMQIDH